NRLVVIGGAIQEMREITTKNGQKMAFVKLADLTSEIEVVLFPGAYQQTMGIWERDRVVLVRGKLSAIDRQTGQPLTELKVLADEARETTIEQAKAYQPTGKTMKLPNPSKSVAKPAKAAEKTSSEPIKERLYVRLEDTSNHEQ